LADALRKPERKFRIYYFGTDELNARRETDLVIDTAESLDFETVADEYVDARVRDLFQRIRKIFSTTPDLLFVTTSLEGTPNFMRQAAKIGIRAEMSVAGLNSFEAETISTIGDKANDVLTATRYSYLIDSEENKLFLAEWRKLYPNSNPTATAAAGSYTALMVAHSAYEKAGSQDVKEFREAMKDLEINAPQGRVIVSGANNLLIQPLYAAKVKDGILESLEYLGDVSHPALDSCIIEQPEEEQAIEEIKRY